MTRINRRQESARWILVTNALIVYVSKIINDAFRNVLTEVEACVIMPSARYLQSDYTSLIMHRSIRMLVMTIQHCNGNNANAFGCIDRPSKYYGVLAYAPAIEGSFDFFLFFFFVTTLTSVPVAGADDCSLPFSCVVPLLP